MGKFISPSDIGVVIQGPIQSVGRTLTDLKSRAYDCTADVKTMLEEIKSLGSLPLVVTWHDQNIGNFSFDERGYIKKIPFPGVAIWKSLKNDWNNNSKYRQYYSTLIGSLELRNSGCKYVVKIRTDNLVDISQLIRFILTLDPLKAEKYFYTPLINLDRPHMFYDFYFFASISKVEEFCNVILYEKERTTNIHYDVFYRWTKHELNSKFSFSDIKLIYPKYPFYTTAQLRLIRKGLEEVYRPLPQEIWKSLYWRGEQFDAQGLKEHYRFAETPAENILSDFDKVKANVSDKSSMDYLSIPSFFVTSRLEFYLNKVHDYIGAKRNSNQFLRNFARVRSRLSSRLNFFD
jgi:hypothetical protein